MVNPPVWRASTHLYEDSAALAAGVKNNADGTFFYGRRGAPTQWALADALTQLEPGADGTVLYPSGVAAITGALLAVLKPGDVLLVSDNAYEPTRTNALGLLKTWGVETRFFDPLDLEGFAAHFCDRTRAVMLEAPGSLTMEVCDIPALTAIARDRGAVSLIDNTWATSLGFPRLQHGCDIAIMSLTKHVGGHSDLMMGSASAGDRWHRALRRTGAGARPCGVARRCGARIARLAHDGPAAGTRCADRRLPWRSGCADATRWRMCCARCFQMRPAMRCGSAISAAGAACSASC